MSELSLERLEARLARAAASYLKDLRAAQENGDRTRELRATLSRLGFRMADIETLVSPGGCLPSALRAEMGEALRRESAYQLRCARGHRTGYDLNRHMVVARALREFDRHAATPSAPAAPRERRGRRRSPRR
ncbi:hypothetical protein [Aureimonas mangrovi]|uniref:hypothetical protein n=1 Tax=Aureimonas mangrovi TaxID=2758041 RepID=UPI00163D6655|nr:hypothetical protein [Aureimonas mangrovi]